MDNDAVTMADRIEKNANEAIELARELLSALAIETELRKRVQQENSRLSAVDARAERYERWLHHIRSWVDQVYVGGKARKLREFIDDAIAGNGDPDPDFYEPAITRRHHLKETDETSFRAQPSVIDPDVLADMKELFASGLRENKSLTVVFVYNHPAIRPETATLTALADRVIEVREDGVRVIKDRMS